MQARVTRRGVFGQPQVEPALRAGEAPVAPAGSTSPALTQSSARASLPMPHARLFQDEGS